VKKEAADFIKLTLDVYKDFGFTDIAMKLSTRPAKRVAPKSCGTVPKAHWPTP
jgi:threonyl-tRNA synthetase (EC 6.1.1.3)/Ser-tRNA(Thr) hydrolase (EC 3.1.1.-)